jgi:hypothetical protein
VLSSQIPNPQLKLGQPGLYQPLAPSIVPCDSICEIMANQLIFNVKFIFSNKQLVPTIGNNGSRDQVLAYLSRTKSKQNSIKRAL